MIRRGLAVAGVGALLACAVAEVPAAAPDGPRLAFVSLVNDKSRALRLETVDGSGAVRRTLLAGRLARDGKGPMPFFAPSWSPDGTRLAVIVLAGKQPRSIHLISSDGRGSRVVPETKGGTDPVLSPDGKTLAFARSRIRFEVDMDRPTGGHFYSSTTTWTIDLTSGQTRRLTPWRDGLENTPTSFSPDGSVLALTKRDNRLDGPRTVLLHVDDGRTRLLLREATEPAISPDGTQVALIGYKDGSVVETDEGNQVSVGELYTIRIDGTQLTRLTRTHDQLESRPSWDPSGQRIAYNQFHVGTGLSPTLNTLFPYGNAIMQINADGSCRSKALSIPRVAIYGAAWQPGAGREAGRISC
ncbi:MAG TPA: hypothetical protein VNP96_11915 [Solirubrobacterales bacterium]|nr:hypothetical protein [Solirubrobacterales bacterium]